MTHHEPIRVLYACNHATVYPGLGVFLAGPTPPVGDMPNGWRRRVIRHLLADQRLDPSMIVVAPEPESGRWSDILVDTGRPRYDHVTNRQIPWEWQYLGLCDVTVFWLPTYWSKDRGGVLGDNIGPTARWEFGYYFQEYVKNPQRRTFIAGAPEDAESVKWARRLVQTHRLPWHVLPQVEKESFVPSSLLEAVVEALLRNRSVD